MGKFASFLFLLLLLGVIGGGVFLATWEIPAPTKTMEIAIPNDRFQE